MPTDRPERVISGAVGAGVATRDELRRLGIADGAIDRRLRTGFLVPVHRGVLAVGRAPSDARTRWLAGIAAAGDGAALSHASAAACWGWTTPDAGPVHVTRAGRGRSRRDLVVHASSVLSPRSVTVRDGVPCTTAARTLVDFAGSAGDAAAVRAWSTAASRRQLRPRDLAFELERGNGRAGAAVVRRLFEHHTRTYEQRTRTELERLALRFVSERALPAPVANGLIVVGAHTFEADLGWPDRRLVAELDGRTAHEHMVAFEGDRERDAVLGLAGWRVTRLTWADLEARPACTAARIRGLLAQEPLRPAPGRSAARVRNTVAR